MEEINTIRKGLKIETLTSVDIVEIVSCGVLEFFEGFFCRNLEYNPYTKFVTNMFDKRYSFKTQAKDLFQNLAKRLDCQRMVVMLEKI